MNDIIIRAAFEECEIDLQNGALTCLEQKLLSGHHQVNSRLPTMAFDDEQSSLRGFPKELLKCFNYRHYAIDVITSRNQMRNGQWAESRILRRHFEWQK